MTKATMSSAKITIQTEDEPISPERPGCLHCVHCDTPLSESQTEAILKERAAPNKFMKWLETCWYAFGELRNGKPNEYGTFWIILTMIVTMEIYLDIICNAPKKPGIFEKCNLTPIYNATVAVILFVWGAPLALLSLTKWATPERLIKLEQPRSVIPLLILYAITLTTSAHSPLLWFLTTNMLHGKLILTSTMHCTIIVFYWLASDIFKSRCPSAISTMIATVYMLEGFVILLYAFENPIMPANFPEKIA